MIFNQNITPSPQQTLISAVPAEFKLTQFLHVN